MELSKCYTAYLPYDLYFQRHEIVYYGGKEEFKGKKRGVVIYENKRKGKMFGVNKGLNKIITHCGSFHPSAETILKEERLVTRKIIFKPILRPWKYLTEEIEHKGEKFVPLVGLAKISFFKNDKHDLIDDYVDLGHGYSFHLHNNSDGVSFSCKMGFDGKKWDYDCFVPNQFELFQKLLEWHFNVFNLPENLFVDINTLKQRVK